jgi:hypothetical protein
VLPEAGFYESTIYPMPLEHCRQIKPVTARHTGVLEYSGGEISVGKRPPENSAKSRALDDIETKNTQICLFCQPTSLKLTKGLVVSEKMAVFGS